MPFCAKCGTNVNPGVKFCQNCGTEMQASSTPTPVPTPQPQQSAPQTVGPCEKHLLPGETIIDDLDRKIYLTTHRVLILGQSETFVGKLARFFAGEVNGDIAINEIVGLKFGRIRPWYLFLIGLIFILPSPLLLSGSSHILEKVFVAGLLVTGLVCLVIWYLGRRVFTIEGNGTRFEAIDLENEPTEFAKKIRMQYYQMIQ